MERKYLIIDEGNSRAKISILSPKGNIEQCYIVPHLEEIFLAEVYNRFNIEKSIYCSVREKNRGVIEMLNRSSELHINFDFNTAIPLANEYSTPQTLGMDRLAAAIGAAAIYPRESTVVVDFGSAITIDFVEGGAAYMGGNISPGASLRFKSLNQFTDKLPLCVLSREEKELCSGDTKDAIEAGIAYGITYEISGYIDEYIRKYKNIKIIFTGGDAEYFGNKFKMPIFVDCDVVTRGLYQVLKYNDVLQKRK